MEDNIISFSELCSLFNHLMEEFWNKLTAEEMEDLERGDSEDPYKYESEQVCVKLKTKIEVKHYFFPYGKVDKIIFLSAEKSLYNSFF